MNRIGEGTDDFIPVEPMPNEDVEQVQPTATGPVVGFKPLEPISLSVEVGQPDSSSAMVETSPPTSPVVGFKPLEPISPEVSGLQDSGGKRVEETPLVGFRQVSPQVEMNTSTTGFKFKPLETGVTHQSEVGQQDTDERKQRNREFIKILLNEEKFNGALREITLLNGSKGIVFERNMVNFDKGELPSYLGIKEQYSSPQSFKDIFQEKRSVIMLTEEGMIFLVAGSTYRRHESDYNLIYKEVLHRKEVNNPDAQVFQANFSNADIGLPTMEGPVAVKGQEAQPFSGEDANFYSAVYMADILDSRQEDFNTMALLRELTEATVLAKEREELMKKRSVS